jgi:hypothetical protein
MLTIILQKFHILKVLNQDLLQNAFAVIIENKKPLGVLRMILDYGFDVNKQFPGIEWNRSSYQYCPLVQCIALKVENGFYTPNNQTLQYITLLMDYGANPEQAYTSSIGLIQFKSPVALAEHLCNGGLINVLCFYQPQTKQPTYGGQQAVVTNNNSAQ